jgi:hypothetical protein
VPQLGGSIRGLQDRKEELESRRGLFERRREEYLRGE